MTYINMLYLSVDDVEQLGLTVEQCIEAVDATFKEHGKGAVALPEKQAIHPHESPSSFTHAMSAYVPALHGLGMKYIAYNPVNHEKGIPDSMGLMVINDPETLQPVCIMEAGLLTYIRTGAIAAVTARYCAKSVPKTVAFIGVGGLARWVLFSLEREFNSLKQVKGFDIREIARENFVRDMKERSNCQILPVSSPREALEGADIIVSTVPGPIKPFLKEEWWNPGSLAIVLSTLDCWEPKALACADRLSARR